MDLVNMLSLILIFWCVVCLRESPSISCPLACGRGLATEPEVVADGPALLQRDVVDAVPEQVGRDEAVLGDHGVGGGSGLAWAALVDGSNPELVLLALHQAVALALDLVAHGLHLLDGQGLALDPLAHVLLLHLDDVVGDGGATVRGRWVPHKVGMVGRPVYDVGLAAWVGLV